MARDLKGNDKGRDDLLAETPPWDTIKIILSKAITRRRDEGYRKAMFNDVRKTRLKPRREKDVYIKLPEECGCLDGMCGKLKFWLYGFRQTASE